MDAGHIVLLVLWLIFFVLFLGEFIVLVIVGMKSKGGAPGMRGVYVMKPDTSGFRRFFARHDAGHWKKSSGAEDEFVVVEKTGFLFGGKGIDHRIKEDNCYIEEGKNETVIIDGLDRMNVHYQKLYNKEKTKNRKLLGEIGKLRHELHHAQTQIEQKSHDKANQMVTMAGKVLQSTRQKQTNS